jgi:hypothetical protein
VNKRQRNRGSEGESRRKKMEMDKLVKKENKIM